jgi:hypothetical protein
MLHRVIAVTGLLVSFGVVIAPGKTESDGAGSKPLPKVAQGKEPEYSGQNATKVSTRLSYDSTYVADGTDERRSPRICLQVDEDGHFRISRLTTGATENLEGRLSQGQMSQLASLLKKVGFESKLGGMVRNGSETFVAEIVRGDQTVRYIWVNPDHQRAFPQAAADLIEWMQKFKPQGASTLLAAEWSAQQMRICPRMSDNPLQPVADRAKHGTECTWTGDK